MFLWKCEKKEQFKECGYSWNPPELHITHHRAWGRWKIFAFYKRILISLCSYNVFMLIPKVIFQCSVLFLYLDAHKQDEYFLLCIWRTKSFENNEYLAEIIIIQLHEFYFFNNYRSFLFYIRQMKTFDFQTEIPVYNILKSYYKFFMSFGGRRNLHCLQF